VSEQQQGYGKQTFEEGMRALEGIVSRLEGGNLPLEESLAAFEKGVAVLRALHEQLGEVERRVEVLLRDADGVLRTRDGSDLAR
jgi:exodeoxyribonuclease VII small subunit